MDIQIRELSKSYGEKRVLDGLSAVLREGCVSGIMGPSGCGKTTLIRILAGLEKADGGEIDGLEGRRVSMVFQEDRLCGDLSLEANIRLACGKKIPGEKIERAMEAVGLSGLSGQRARELSGGMRRRVALLRALLAPWDLLLLDEPFKGLDEETKGRVISYTNSRIEGRTVLLVTHEQREISLLGGMRLPVFGE